MDAANNTGGIDHCQVGLKAVWNVKFPSETKHNHTILQWMLSTCIFCSVTSSS